MNLRSKLIAGIGIATAALVTHAQEPPVSQRLPRVENRLLPLLIATNMLPTHKPQPTHQHPCKS